MAAPRGRAGFTFLEILIALCVVLLALVPLIRLHVASIQMIDASSRRAKAVFLANDRLAEIMAQDTPDLGQSTGRIEDANDGTTYRWTTVVTDARPPELEPVPWVGIRQVHVNVAWQNGNRDAMVSFDTLIHVAVASEREILEDKDNGKNDNKAVLPVRIPL